MSDSMRMVDVDVEDAAGTPWAVPSALRIGYLPFGRITNRYAERFIEILGAFGIVSALPQPRAVLRNPAALARRLDLAVLNWVEFDLVRRDGAFSPAGFAKTLARVLFARCIARRVIYVRHNHFPHGTRERDVDRARRALDLVERLADVVLVHSGHDPYARREYVPHPLYHPVPEALDPDERRRLSELPADCYVVFGRIEPYKRIERLIDVFPHERRLLVFGAAGDADYARMLSERAGANVRILAGYVSDAFAQAVVRRCRALILCHAEPEMIVSGSLFYALSLGTPVLALSTLSIDWLGERLGGGHVRVAPDLQALAALVAADDARTARLGIADAAVEREFGDERIRARLREVLFP